MPLRTLPIDNVDALVQGYSRVTVLVATAKASICLSVRVDRVLLDVRQVVIVIRTLAGTATVPATTISLVLNAGGNGS